MDDVQGRAAPLLASTRAATPTRARRCVVIGSNNSAHDICADLWEARRRRDDGAALVDAHRPLRHADGARARRALLRAGGRERASTTDKADLIFASRALPDHARRSRSRSTTRWSERDADFYARLEQGRLPARLRRGRLGPVHEVPAPRLGLLHRRRRLRAHRRRQDQARDGVTSSSSTETRSCSTDGSELPADLIVYATGYGSMNGWAAELISPGGRRQGRQGLGPRLGHDEGPGPVGGRAAQHVEADAAGGAVVPRRQPAPVAALLAVTWRCSSRRAWRASPRRSTGCRRCTTLRDRRTRLARRLSPHDVPRYTMRAHMFTPPTFESLLP